MNRICLRFASLLATCALACSCASVGTQGEVAERRAKRFDQEPPAGWCGLYVFRTGVVGAGLRRKVWVDGQYAGETGHKTFLYRLVRPGTHFVQTESAIMPNEISVRFVEGRNHFMRQRFTVSGGKFDDDRAGGLSLGNRFFGDTDLVECEDAESAMAAIAGLHLAADAVEGDRSFDLQDAEYGEGRGSSSRDCSGPPPEIPAPRAPKTSVAKTSVAKPSVAKTPVAETPVRRDRGSAAAAKTVRNGAGGEDPGGNDDDVRRAELEAARKITEAMNAGNGAGAPADGGSGR